MKFGNYNPEVAYRRRPGAYAVIFDGQGKFAAVRWQNSFLLPGGGVDPGESLEEALAREVREECACEVVIGGFLGDAIQYFNNENGRSWEFHCSYFEAQFGSPLDSEPEHELFWLDIADAHKLAHEVHGWAVLMALKAAVDFGVDLRNHDPQRTWDDGHIEN